MTDRTDASIIGQAPLQDRDLLQRLSLYFDGFDHRLRQGQGWLIFNAGGGRSGRIASFIRHRLAEHTPPVAYCFMPWREFALSAYVTEVGLPGLVPSVSENRQAQREFDIAAKVTHDTWTRMLSADLLVLAGLKPARRHEAELLDETIGRRHAEKLATIILTPEMPRGLEAEFETVDPSRVYWERLFGRMYETSLVAL